MEIPSVGEEPAGGVNADLCTEEPVFQGARESIPATASNIM